MGRIKQTPRMTTGGRAPKKQLASKSGKERFVGDAYKKLEIANDIIHQLNIKLKILSDLPKCTICHHHPATFIGMCGHRICCVECHSNPSCRRSIYKLSNCPLCRKWIGLDSGEMLYQLKH